MNRKASITAAAIAARCAHAAPLRAAR